jgi:hypothetical protein
MDRRRFVKSAGLGAAGLLLNSVVSKGQEGVTRPESLVLPHIAWGRVWIRWTQPVLPARTLLAYGLAIPWDAGPALVESARKGGYRVYAAATLEQALAAANNSRALEISGIILEAGDSEQLNVEKTAADLRLAHPDLTILSPDPRSKQPSMMGSTVISNGGILQISSPTEQPWINSNLAVVAYDRAFRPTQTPLIDFKWDHSDVLQQQLGPSPEDYSLAVAEAGSLHSDLILHLHPSLEKALVSGSAEGWVIWNRVAKYIEFYLREGEPAVAFPATVGVVTDNYDASYEATNLMARHNIPFRFLSPSHLTSQELQGLALIVVFAQSDKAVIRQIAGFVDGGGMTILVSVPDPFPGHSSGTRRVSGDSVIYPMGGGKVIELANGVANPETFSRDVRRLLGEEKLPISLWNASSTIAIPYSLPGTSTATVDLLNYSADPMPVQVRLRGTYSEVRYETPEHGCCEVLTPTHQDGFTQFDVPWLRIGGRVYLGPIALPQRNRS